MEGSRHQKDSLAVSGRRKPMPVGVVKTLEDEIAWERAKARAREQYPDVTGQRFYRIVMAIYKKMTHYQKPAASLEMRPKAGQRVFDSRRLHAR
jgi:hypothetical protein